eukprot:scaffold180338_cov33-Tisochrysis_lutea.AAC.2
MMCTLDLVLVHAAIGVRRLVLVPTTLIGSFRPARPENRNRIQDPSEGIVEGGRRASTSVDRRRLVTSD